MRGGGQGRDRLYLNLEDVRLDNAINRFLSKGGGSKLYIFKKNIKKYRNRLNLMSYALITY